MAGRALGRWAESVRSGTPCALLTILEASEGGVGEKLLLNGEGELLEGGFTSTALQREAEEGARPLLARGESGVLDLPMARVFVDVVARPPRLVIVGAVHIAITLARFARELGFRTLVCDARDRFATSERFPEVDELIVGWPGEVLSQLHLDAASHIVVITHDAKLDNPALLAALASPAPYIGALGSRRTHERRVRALREAGASEEAIARIHAPIGLDIGARTPAEIALAILAEIVAVRRAAPPPPT